MSDMNIISREQIIMFILNRFHVMKRLSLHQAKSGVVYWRIQADHGQNV